ncbi:MAG: LppP/LprE family lipoprotein [Dehalococcoidia bacterium]
MIRRTMWSLAIALLIGGAAVARPAATNADGGWLDQQPAAVWNQPGMDVPAAPLADSVDPRCLARQRPAETDEDYALTGAGWTLVGTYQGGWGIKTVIAASNFDGMCRPLGYQEFVFADGQFAGTVSPFLMDSRSDGAANFIALQGPDRIAVRFARYTAADALCCPSAESSVFYTIDRSSGNPVLVLTSVMTQKTSAGG